MKYALLYTKLNRPSVAPDIVQRGRLIKQLDQGRKRSLTLISASAGYSKSTLVSRWIASRDYPCAWVSLDKNDNDLSQFLNYLLAAIQRVFDKIHLRTETLLDAAQNGEIKSMIVPKPGMRRAGGERRKLGISG